MTKILHKPTPAQLEALQGAIGDKDSYTDAKPVGRVKKYGIVSITLNVLIERGWIERDKYVRDPAERQALVDRFNAFIADANRVASESRMAASAEAADAIQGTLNTDSYWITDAGREVVPK